MIAVVASVVAAGTAAVAALVRGTRSAVVARTAVVLCTGPTVVVEVVVSLELTGILVDLDSAVVLDLDCGTVRSLQLARP